MPEYEPIEFVPGSRRHSRALLRAYGIGVEREPRCWGMWAGPFERLDDALDRPGREARKDAIIRFNEDGSEDVLYRWTGSSWRHI